MCYRNGTGHRCECCGQDRVELRMISYNHNGFSENEMNFIGYVCDKEERHPDINRKSLEPALMIAVTPGEPMKIITELEAGEYLPGFEYGDSISEVPEMDLVMSYLGIGILRIGDRFYLDTPFLIYNLDEDGELVSLSGEEMYAVQEFLKERTIMVRQDGEEMPVIDLN